MNVKFALHRIINHLAKKKVLDKEDDLFPIFAPDLQEHQKLSLIRWIANRIRQMLEINPNDNLNKDLMFFSRCLVNWHVENEDVGLRINELALPDHDRFCLLNIYEEMKEDISYYCKVPVTPKEKHLSQEEIWQVYRDVIYAVTQRRFLLIQKSEVEPYKIGRIICQTSIVERSDISKTREIAKKELLASGVPQALVSSQMLVISEAITNIIKHAIEGSMTMVETDSSIHAVVEDKGPGIPLQLLPNTILMSGFSTKKSLGQGFTIMMKLTEMILLSTIPDEGSTLILVFNRFEKKG